MHCPRRPARAHAGAILAHECMHAWLRLSGFAAGQLRHLGGEEGLDLQVEEGLCQLMALLWLEAQQVRSKFECVYR